MQNSVIALHPTNHNQNSLNQLISKQAHTNLPFGEHRLFQSVYEIVVGKGLHPVAFEFEKGVRSIYNQCSFLVLLISYCYMKEEVVVAAGVIEKYESRKRKGEVEEDS